MCTRNVDIVIRPVERPKSCQAREVYTEHIFIGKQTFTIKMMCLMSLQQLGSNMLNIVIDLNFFTFVFNVTFVILVLVELKILFDGRVFRFL